MLFRGGRQVDPLQVVRHAGEAAHPLLLNDLHRLPNRHPLVSGLLAPLAIDVKRRKLVLGVGQPPAVLHAFLEALVVVRRRTGDAGTRRTLVEDRRQRLRVVHTLGERRRLEVGRDAVIPMVVRVLNAAEGISGHH